MKTSSKDYITEDVKTKKYAQRNSAHDYIWEMKTKVNDFYGNLNIAQQIFFPSK